MNTRGRGWAVWAGACAGTMAVLLGASALAVPPEIAVLQGVSTGSMPKGATLSPDGTRVYVANYGQANRRNITVYDSTTLALLDTIDVPGIVVETAISPDGHTLYASNFRRD